MIKQLCDALFEQTPKPSVYGRSVNPKDCWPIRVQVPPQLNRLVLCKPHTLLQWKKALTPEGIKPMTCPPLHDCPFELSMFRLANPNKWTRGQMKLLEILATEPIVKYCQKVNSIYHDQDISVNATIYKLWPNAPINSSPTYDLIWSAKQNDGCMVNKYGTWICPLDLHNTSEQLCWLARWQDCYEIIEFVAPLSSGFPYLETFVILVNRKPGVEPREVLPHHTSNMLHTMFLLFWRQVMRRVRWNIAVTQDAVPFQSNNVLAIADWYTFWSNRMPINPETYSHFSGQEDIPDYYPTSPVNACPNSPTIHDSLAPF